MSDSPDPAGGQEALGDGGADEAQPTRKQAPTEYLVLWAKLPDPDDERNADDDGRRFRIHSSGIHKATNRDTVKRKIWLDEEAPEHRAIHDAAADHGVEIRPIPVRNFGDYDDVVRTITQTRDVWGQA